MEERIKRIQHCLMDWYAVHRRDLPWRTVRDPYAIWVSEVMLQQTQVQTVVPYYLKFMERFPTIASLAQSDLESVLKVWEGMGYYTRARNLHRAAMRVMEDYQAVFPKTQEALLELPGVGPYIANAVTSIAFGCPVGVVDGNVKRVVSRLLMLKAKANDSKSHKIYQEIADRLLLREAPGEFNQAVMELGALVCTPKTPKCQECPLGQVCEAHKKGKVADFPKRRPGKKKPLQHLTGAVIVKEGKLLVLKRLAEGLLGGLWEFPDGRRKAGEDPEQACHRILKEEYGLRVRVNTHLTRESHVYTHFNVVLDVYVCSYQSGTLQLKKHDACQWIFLSELHQFPFTGVNRKFFKLLEHMNLD